jgi:hypothetical protein
MQGSWYGEFKAGPVACKSVATFLGTGFGVSHFRNSADNGPCQYGSFTQGLVELVGNENNKVIFYYSTGSSGGLRIFTNVVAKKTMKLAFFSNCTNSNSCLNYPDSFVASNEVWTLDLTYNMNTVFVGSYATASGAALPVSYAFFGNLVMSQVNNPLGVYIGAITYVDMPATYSGQTVKCYLDLPFRYNNGVRDTDPQVRRYCLIKYDAGANSMTITSKDGAFPSDFDDATASKTVGYPQPTNEISGQWEGTQLDSQDRACRVGFFTFGLTYWAASVCPNSGGLYIGQYELSTSTVPKHLTATQYLGLSINNQNGDPTANHTTVIKEGYTVTPGNPTKLQLKIAGDGSTFPTDMAKPYMIFGEYTRYSDIYRPSAGATNIVSMVFVGLAVLLCFL